MAPADAGGRLPPGGYAGYPNKRARVAGTLFTGIWLAYLVPAVVDLLTQANTPLVRWGGVAILVVFAAVYMTLVPNWAFSPRYALPGVALLAALTVAGCVLLGGDDAAGLWIFVSSACGLLVPNARRAVMAVLGSTACYVVFSVTGHANETDFLTNLLPTVFVGLAMIGLRRQFQLTAELTRAREEVVQLAANEERLRLARDMHDLTGQSLSMITLKSELAARLLQRLPDGTDRDRVRDEIEQVAAVSRQTLRDIREAVSGYRRPTLAVEIITARATLASAGIAAHDDADLTLLSGTFAPEAEAALAWCLREAVTNVVRHSNAKNCHISLTRRSGSVSLTVRDDGRGHVPPDAAHGCEFGVTMTPNSQSPANSHPPASAEGGSGLHGMSERLSAVGGTLEIRPNLHPGFCLIATVPKATPQSASPLVRSSSRTINEIINSSPRFRGGSLARLRVARREVTLSRT